MDKTLIFSILIAIISLLFSMASMAWEHEIALGYGGGRENADSRDEINTPTVIRGSVGYNHDFSPSIGVGVEVGKGRYGDTLYHFSNSSEVHIFTDTLEFLGEFSVHLMPVDFFSKVGGVRVTPIITHHTTAEVHTIVDPEIICGVAYNFKGNSHPFLRHFAITLSYLKIVINTHDDKNIKDPTSHIWEASSGVNAVILGLRYTFGP